MFQTSVCGLAKYNIYEIHLGTELFSQKISDDSSHRSGGSNRTYKLCTDIVHKPGAYLCSCVGFLNLES